MDEVFEGYFTRLIADPEIKKEGLNDGVQQENEEEKEQNEEA